MFCLIEAPKLTSQLPSLMFRRNIACLSLSFTSIILVRAQRSRGIVLRVLEPGVVIQDWLSYRMITVLRRLIRASIDVVLVSSLTLLNCRILCLRMLFLHLISYLLSNAGSTGTIEALAKIFFCLIILVFLIFLFI